MEKAEKNKLELQKFVDQLKNKKVKSNGDIELFGRVNFNCASSSKEDTVRINLLTGHHAGKVLVIDENGTFKGLFVRFISNSQDYEFTKDGFLKISDTSGLSKLGNYEVIIEEKETKEK